MIRIDQIDIEEFRGIKKLSLSLKQKNFGICGSNGTGKSGIVDAIEFALTGDITRLTGSGSEGLTIKAHAPHVDTRATPEKCCVKVTAFAPTLNKKITIERRVSSASSPTIFPNEPKVLRLVEQLASHPEFALSRREIVKYVITPAGQRAKDVQLLLRLEQIEKVRLSLQKLSNDLKKEAQSAKIADDRAKADLLAHLGIASPSKSAMLAAVNERRTILGLQTLADFGAGASLKEGVVSTEEKKEQKPRISKPTALARLKSLRDDMAELNSPTVTKARADAVSILDALKANPESLRSFKKQVLVQQGLDAIEDDACPLCDTAWDRPELEAHLREKLLQAADAADQLRKLEEAILPIVTATSHLNRTGEHMEALGEVATPPIPYAPLSAFIQVCVSGSTSISHVLSDPTEIESALAALSEAAWAPPETALQIIEQIQQGVDALPDPSKEEQAREFLIVAQERYDRCGTTKKQKERAESQSAVALGVFEHYGSASKSVLEGIYDAVEKDFTAYYRIINEEDEGQFEGKLVPSVGKLAFNVDFYGRGKFPPGAYHSEGHQDGMGLCLYLALVKHTLGDNFSFAVLDDVLMSVDASHRREVCTLLKSTFPKTQFLLTTHDPVWLAFMKTEKLVQSSVMFGGWSVDNGPQVWEDTDVWQNIATKLAQNDVSGAAATLRRFLEYIATVLADNFRAPVEYHGNGSYDLGDLMPSVAKTWKSLIQSANKSALSWGADTAAIEKMESEANERVQKSFSEQWMINKAVHYNEWHNLQKGEFEAVVNAFRSLLESMQCDNPQCAEFFYVVPSKGSKEALRCGCGKLNLNLRSKK